MTVSSVSITKSQTLLLAVIVGATVATLFYIQPLLPRWQTMFNLCLGHRQGGHAHAARHSGGHAGVCSAR